MAYPPGTKEGGMVGTSREQGDIYSKLLVVARGDIDLVQRAIRKHAPSPSDPADLEQVVKYILENRKEREDNKEKTGRAA